MIAGAHLPGGHRPYTAPCRIRAKDHRKDAAARSFLYGYKIAGYI